MRATGEHCPREVFAYRYSVKTPSHVLLAPFGTAKYRVGEEMSRGKRDRLDDECTAVYLATCSQGLSLSGSMALRTGLPVPLFFLIENRE